MNLNLLKRTRMYKGYQQYEVADGIGLTRIVLFLNLTFNEVNEIFFDNVISK